MLDCICVDCSERVITWSVRHPALATPQETVSSPTTQNKHHGKHHCIVMILVSITSSKAQ